MERERNPMEPMEIDRVLDRMRRKGCYSMEEMNLAKEDMEYGLTREEIDSYLKMKGSIRRKRIYSNCIRRGCSEEEMEVICGENLDDNQMAVLYDMLEKGVNIQTMKDIAIGADYVPHRMEEAYKKLLAMTEDAMKMTDEHDASKDAADLDYIRELTATLKEITEKIVYQENRYDELNRKLKIFETAKRDEEAERGLVKQLDETTANLNSSQDQLNRANSTIARLREQIEDKDKTIAAKDREIGRMERRIEVLEDKVLEKADMSVRPESEKILEDEKEEIREEGVSAMATEVVKPHMQQGTYAVPIYYQVPVVNGQGAVIQHVSVEHTSRKNGNAGIAGFFAKLGFAKKSRQDIVKLVAGGDLTPAQLVQIRNAMMKGLTEGQLVELINNNVPAEKMKEIIEIAVLENSMDY